MIVCDGPLFWFERSFLAVWWEHRKRRKKGEKKIIAFSLSFLSFFIYATWWFSSSFFFFVTVLSNRLRPRLRKCSLTSAGAKALMMWCGCMPLIFFPSSTLISLRESTMSPRNSNLRDGFQDRSSKAHLNTLTSSLTVLWTNKGKVSVGPVQTATPDTGKKYSAVQRRTCKTWSAGLMLRWWSGFPSSPRLQSFLYRRCDTGLDHHRTPVEKTSRKSLENWRNTVSSEQKFRSNHSHLNAPPINLV